LAPLGTFGEEVETAFLSAKHVAMDAPIDLEHVRRARRVLALLVERFGVSHFLQRADARAAPQDAINPSACSNAVELASHWIARRTGRAVSAQVMQLLHRDLRHMVRKRVCEGNACVR
jgi:hypothetical protein